MKIKQTTFYAMRILCRIYKEENMVVTSKEIAEKEELSQGVIAKILRELSHAGMLHAHQGRGQNCGGFSLGKDIDDITMLDVIDVMEGMDISENLDKASRKKAKALDLACDQINGEMRKVFSGYSIGYLLESDEGYQIRAG